MKQVIDGANPTVVQARETAKNQGIRTCMMYASTPGDLETQYGREWQEILDKMMRFNEHMYDFDREDLGKFFTIDGTAEENERNNDAKRITMVYIEFDGFQLRKSQEWYDAQYNEAVNMNTIGEYRRGVLLQRFRGDNSALFDQNDLDYMKNHIRKPDYCIFLMKKFNLFVYKHKVYNVDLTSDTPYFDIDIPYLIGIDIATGGGGDNTAIIIINPYTLEICGVLKSPYIGLFDLMRIVTALGRLIPKGVFCPEANSVGKALVEFGMETKLQHRFYHDPKLDITKNAITVEDNSEIALKRKAKERGYIGTNVTKAVRDTMFDLLKRYVKDYKELITCEFLVNDICNLVKNKNGKIEAASGFHDDVVMAYNHVIYILNYGYDLTRFGIDKRRCSFEKVLDVVATYEKETDDAIVNNMVPYDCPTLYEEQLLNDLTADPGSGFVLDEYGRDRYGYRPEDYDTRQGMEEKESAYESFTNADYAIYSSMQNF